MSDYNIDKSDYKRDARIETPPAPPPVAEPPAAKEHSRFLLLILALVPGLGHMYLGLVRRGLFYLSAFAFTIFVTVQFAIMGLAPFVVLAVFGIVAVVFMAFFESLVARRDLALGKKLEDSAPAFVKTKAAFISIAAFLIIPFVINLLNTLPWYSWIILGFIFVVAIAYFGKKPK